MTRTETLAALLVLKQPGLFDKLSVALNGAHYVFRCIRTDAGVTVRFGQSFNERDLAELLPRVAETALTCLLDQKRADLLREQHAVRTQLTLARNMARELSFRIDGLKLLAEQFPAQWHTDYLATQYLLNSMAQREPLLAARYQELDDLLDPDTTEEDA